MLAAREIAHAKERVVSIAHPRCHQRCATGHRVFEAGASDVAKRRGHRGAGRWVPGGERCRLGRLGLGLQGWPTIGGGAGCGERRRRGELAQRLEWHRGRRSGGAEVGWEAQGRVLSAQVGGGGRGRRRLSSEAAQVGVAVGYLGHQLRIERRSRFGILVQQAHFNGL